MLLMSSLKGAKRTGSELIAEQLQETTEDPLGHAPDDCVIEPVGLDLAALTGDLETGQMVTAWLKKLVDGNPLRCSYFRVGNEGGTRGEEEGEGSNRDGWESGSPGHHVVEAPKQVLGDEVDPDLFLSFPDDGGKEIRIRSVVPAARQGHVPRPGITQAVGTSYQENGIGVGRDHDGHCGPDERGIFSGAGMAVGQALLEPGEPAGQCE